MGQIYKNSIATIMAAAASSASEGFLEDNAQEILSCEVFLTAPDGISGRVKVCPREDFDFQSMPLSKRAWCFPEYVLSSRHLFFTDKELVWQCRFSKVATVSQGSIRYPYHDNVVPFGISREISSDSHDRTHENNPRRGQWPVVELRGKSRGRRSTEEPGREQ